MVLYHGTNLRYHNIKLQEKHPSLGKSVYWHREFNSVQMTRYFPDAHLYAVISSKKFNSKPVILVVDENRLECPTRQGDFECIILADYINREAYRIIEVKPNFNISDEELRKIEETTRLVFSAQFLS